MSWESTVTYYACQSASTSCLSLLHCDSTLRTRRSLVRPCDSSVRLARQRVPTAVCPRRRCPQSGFTRTLLPLHRVCHHQQGPTLTRTHVPHRPQQAANAETAAHSLPVVRLRLGAGLLLPPLTRLHSKGVRHCAPSHHQPLPPIEQHSKSSRLGVRGALSVTFDAQERTPATLHCARPPAHWTQARQSDRLRARTAYDLGSLAHPL
ncbi:hypothetical protein C8R43DRAFT_365875 [Mycena crocata]|nr:hypothetical protein C8R43DRAFT_365875 [Mycena crocata]